MRINYSKTKFNYETIIKIKKAAEILKKGFSMQDIIDFFVGNNLEIVGEPSNTSKWQIAKLTLESIKSRSKLDIIFRKILENKQWYYRKPVKEINSLKKIVQTISTIDSSTENEITITLSNLHSVIKKTSYKLFQDGYYSQAIFEAYKAVINQVKKVSGIASLDGKPLMEKVFSLNTPIIKLNKLQSISDKDEQLGFMFLFCGAALGIRNPKAHGNVNQKKSLRTLEYLVFASLLLKRLDERLT